MSASKVCWTPEPRSPGASQEDIALTGWKNGTLQWWRKLLSIDSDGLADADAEPLQLILERHRRHSTTKKVLVRTLRSGRART